MRGEFGVMPSVSGWKTYFRVRGALLSAYLGNYSQVYVA